MKKNKNVRQDNLSAVNTGSKRVYKMYKAKKNWVVAPVLLATVLGTIGTAPISVLAQTTDATTTVAVVKTLEAAKEDSLKKLDSLVESMTATQMDTAKKAINAATSNEAVYNALKTNGYNVVVNNAVVNFESTTVANANKELAKLTNISTDSYMNNNLTSVQTVKNAQQTFVNETTVTDTTDNFKTTQAKFNTVLAAQNEVVAQNTKNAQTMNAQNANVATKKQAAVATVNGLTYLSQTRKDAYNAQINAVTASDAGWATTIDNLTNQAIQEDVTAAKAVVEAKLASADGQLLSTEKQAQFTASLNQATTTAQVQKIDAEVTKAIAEAKAAHDKAQFEQNKKALIGAINNDTTITDTKVKTDLIAKANSATTQAELDKVNAEYQAAINNAINEKKDIEQVRAEGLATVKALPNITELSRGNYIYAIENASSKSAINTYVAQAQAENNAALATARTAAIAEVNGYTHLSAAEKTAFTNAINKEMTVTGVQAQAKAAKDKDAANYLATTKAEAVKTVNKLEYLDNTEMYVNQINAATSVDAVNSIVDTAAAENLKMGLETTDLNQAKKVGLATVDTYMYLTPSEKEAAVKEINAAKSVDGVKKVLANAETTNAANKQAADAAKVLADAKAAAMKTINGLSSLTEAQKADYNSKVAAADTQAKIDKVVSDAQAADAKIKAEAQALKEAKEMTIANVTKLPYLTNQQKTDYVAQILAANSMKQVEEISLAAKQQNLSQTTNPKEYYANAVDIINNELTALNAEQQKGYVQELGTATSPKSIESMKATVAKATAQNAKQFDEQLIKEIDKMIAAGNLEVAKENADLLKVEANKTAYTAKIDAAIALRTAKEEARNEVTQATYLTPAEKKAFVKQINDAKTMDELNKVKEAYTAKAPATAVPLYRAYNKNNGEHLYTASKAEYDHVVSLGWTAEGTAWNAASKGKPVYRLYNPNSGEHFYTTNETEYNQVASHGWNKEGVVFYSAEDKAVNVYRVFNPNAKDAGSHLYTVHSDEVNGLVKLGWKAEGIAFFGMK